MTPDHPTDPPPKPTLTLAPPDPTLDELLALFRQLTGRDATAEEVEELRREMEGGEAAQGEAGRQ